MWVYRAFMETARWSGDPITNRNSIFGVAWRGDAKRISEGGERFFHVCFHVLFIHLFTPRDRQLTSSSGCPTTSCVSWCTSSRSCTACRYAIRLGKSPVTWLPGCRGLQGNFFISQEIICLTARMPSFAGIFFYLTGDLYWSNKEF